MRGEPKQVALLAKCPLKMSQKVHLGTSSYPSCSDSTSITDWEQKAFVGEISPAPLTFSWRVVDFTTLLLFSATQNGCKQQILIISRKDNHRLYGKLSVGRFGLGADKIPMTLHVEMFSGWKHVLL